jgi:hypothetical protein
MVFLPFGCIITMILLLFRLLMILSKLRLIVCTELAFFMCAADGNKNTLLAHLASKALFKALPDMNKFVKLVNSKFVDDFWVSLANYSHGH